MIMPVALAVSAVLMCTSGLASAQKLPNEQFSSKKGVKLAKGIASIICNPKDAGNGSGSGTHNGHFVTWFEANNGGTNCGTRIGFTNSKTREFRAVWDQNKTFKADAVGGKGWRNGSATRKIKYEVKEFSSNADRKALVAVYGWSCATVGPKNKRRQVSQEYYVVDHWGGKGQFIPFDENIKKDGKKVGGDAKQVGKTIKTDGGTYKFYKVRRNGAQFCFSGKNRSFTQLWSVRQGKRAIKREQTITFSNHANRFDDKDLGLVKSGLKTGYQIVALEAFGNGPDNNKHRGNARIVVK